MKTFKIEKSGEIPAVIKQYIDVYEGREVTKLNIETLDSDIAFIVCDLGIAHGNLNKHSKDAWLCSKNGDNSFNVSISF